MLEIFDKSRKRIAIAENASGVEEERKINSLWYLTFSLPYNDAKNEYCQPFNYVRYNGGELYRIMPVDAEITETGLLTYQCEHVLATLIDNVLFGYHVVGNRGTYTADCIRYVLNRQRVQNWVLYECDFARQFEYGWTQETLLSALFSIATPLADYMWVTDTSVYPWRLSLKSIGLGQKPQLYVRSGWNMLSYGSGSDPQQICTRLYPLGYPSEDSDMLAAEAQYCAMEAELQSKLDNYEATHDYDEYHFDLDEIGHDPYVLVSALTALKGGAWTLSEVQGELQMLFDKQYILTETVETEIRYRPETRYDEDGEPYTVQVPYEYTICTVTLENFDLSHVPVYVMSEDQLALYASYMATLGNRPDLFGDSDYVNRYYGNGSGGSYDIPPEALEDEAFAAIIKEAEKYLGFPYVWGGSSPATSFDCSGFVSYVYNNCGVGWSFGRLSAEGIRQICSYVSPADAKPGDLIFFEKTYNTAGASHIGIYVGNNTMLHCGDPIQYTSISSDYWQSHFLQFGRLAPP